MANTHGGKRPGAGRKSKKEKYERHINAAEKTIADALPMLVEHLLKLAQGGAEIVENTYEPAGMILVDDIDVVHNDNGEPRSVKIKRAAFPDLAPDELVCTKRVVKMAFPDRESIKYAMDRLMGRPTERQEIVDEDGDKVPYAIVRLPGKATAEEWQQKANETANASASENGKPNESGASVS